jgi:hypothetical protein|nr:MAG TPA: Minor structural protein [Caudoviricetes sp.]
MYTGLTDSLWRGAERKELSLTLNGTAVTGALLSLTITASVNGEQSLLTVGNTCAKTVQMQFSGVQTGFLEGSLALSAQAGAETLPLGTFAVTEAVTRGGQTTVTAVDAMGVALAELYQPSLTGSAATAWAVLNDVAAKAGVALSTRASGYQNVLSEVSMASLTAGYTHRTVVGWIAGLCGCNAVIDRAGKLDFIWYSASGMTLHRKECYEGMDEIQESDSVFSMLSVSVVDTNGNTQTLSPASAQGTGALIENPFMTQAQLNGVWSGIGGMTYRPAELSFLGDLRLDAGDLITLTLDDGTTCSVPVMSLTHTYDGGVTTHVTALGQGESAGAGVRNGGVLGGKLRSLSAEVAQLGALTVEDENGVTKINGGRIDTDTLFAQDITATGTITGAQLIGAILSGNAIDIQAVIDATSIGLKTELVDNSYCLVLSAAGGTTKSSITLSRGSLKLVGQSLLELSTDELYINANTITDGNYSKGNYSSFSGSVVSDGTLTVTKKFGVCYLNGGITLTGAVSGWVTLLDSNAVPAPQNGEAIIMTLPSWKAPTTNPARLRIPAAGGLQITRGSANAFWINLAYPIG